MAKDTNDMLSTAKSCIEIAKTKGAKEASARTYRVREVELQWRDGKAEQVKESTTRGVTLQLYVDGRYSSVSTSDLRPDALKQFIGDSIALARTLAVDPHRALPAPELYKGQAKVDLKIEDPKYDAVTPEMRLRFVKELEAAARGAKGHENILSVTTSFSDTLSEVFHVTSNGFSGSRRDTQFWIGTEVSVKDGDGRKPEDYSYAGARFVGELPDATALGREGAQRALSRIGSKKGESAAMTLAIDHRVAGRLVSNFLSPLSASALQQKRSFHEGKLGQQVGSDLVTLSDDPFIPKAFGSRLFDNEGMAMRVRPMIEKGVLKNYYVDTYYGRKLKMAPTTASTSNIAWKLGNRSQAELLADMKEGVFVTSFLGGNSNNLTGDFSLGIQGFRVRNGVIAEPVGEMNMSGNHLELWKSLVAVGNDPYPYSAMRTPTLVFENVSVAGA